MMPGQLAQTNGHKICRMHQLSVPAGLFETSFNCKRSSVLVRERTVLSITSKTNVGVIGCGQISSIYFEAQSKLDNVNSVACSDSDMDRARSQASRYSIPKVCTVEELLADPEIDIVLNLTIPNAHADIALRALEAGKSTYSEKPLA